VKNTAVTICLYQAIPKGEACRKQTRPPVQRAKHAIKNTLDRTMSRISGQLFLDHYHYLGANGLLDNSNRGDIAIGVAVEEQLKTAFSPRPAQFMEVGWGELNDDVLGEVNSRCDLFVIGGGGYVFVGGDGSIGRRLSDLSAFSKIKCPIVGFAIGLNRLLHEQPRELDDLPEDTGAKIKQLSDTCRLLSVRDLDTQDLFRRCARRVPELTGDPVLFLHGDQTPGKSSPKRKIGINLAAHGWRAISVLKKLLPAFIPFLRDIVKAYDFELVYFLHHDLERPVVSFLRDQGFRLSVVDAMPRAMLACYADVDFVICQMLHSCIFAANAGTPFLNIAYDRKSLAFASLLGLPQCALPYQEAAPETLRPSFDGLYRERERLSGLIENRLHALEKSSVAFGKQIAALVG